MKVRSVSLREKEELEPLLVANPDVIEQGLQTENPSIEKKMEYFQSEKVKDLFKWVLDNLAVKHVEIKPIHGLWISFWYKGKRFMYMLPKRNFFVVEVLAPDGNWSDRIRVESKKDWEAAFQKHVSKYSEYLDANK